MLATSSLAMSSAVLVPSLLGSLTFHGHLRFKARWDGFRAELGSNQPVSLSNSSGNNQDPAVQWGEPLVSPTTFQLFLPLYPFLPFLACSLSLPLSFLALSVSSLLWLY